MVTKYAVDTKALKKAMVEKDVNSYVELAELANINRVTASDVVNGKSKPNLSVMYAIAGALDLTSQEAGDIFFAPVIA